MLKSAVRSKVVSSFSRRTSHDAVRLEKSVHLCDIWCSGYYDEWYEGLTTTIHVHKTINYSPGKDDRSSGSWSILFTAANLGKLFLDPSLVWMYIPMILRNGVVESEMITYKWWDRWVRIPRQYISILCVQRDKGTQDTSLIYTLTFSSEDYEEELPQIQRLPCADQLLQKGYRHSPDLAAYELVQLQQHQLPHR